MFNNIIDDVIDRCRPHALTMREQWELFSTGVIDRLDTIVDAVAGDDDVFNLHSIPYVNNGILSPTLIAEVPPTEEWELRYMTLQAGVTNVQFVVFPTMVATADIGTTFPWFALRSDPTTSTALVSSPGNGLIFPAGSQITGCLMSSAYGRGIMQFKSRRKESKRNNYAAGFRNPTPDRTDGDQQEQNEQRHVGSWHPGIPVFGPSAR